MNNPFACLRQWWAWVFLFALSGVLTLTAKGPLIHVARALPWVIAGCVMASVRPKGPWVILLALPFAALYFLVGNVKANTFGVFCLLVLTSALTGVLILIRTSEQAPYGRKWPSG